MLTFRKRRNLAYMLYLTVYEMKCFDDTKRFHCYFIHVTKWWYYRKRGEGGGQKVMIGIIIEVNDANSGRPLSQKKENSPLGLNLQMWGRCQGHFSENRSHCRMTQRVPALHLKICKCNDTDMIIKATLESIIVFFSWLVCHNENPAQ